MKRLIYDRGPFNSAHISIIMVFRMLHAIRLDVKWNKSSSEQSFAIRGLASYFPALLFAVYACVIPQQSLASATFYHRLTTSSTFRECGSGKTQREHLVTGFDGWAVWRQLVLVCVVDKDHAAWVLSAAVTCGADTPDDEACLTLTAHGAPYIVQETDIYPPRRRPDVTYSLIRFFVGFDCIIISNYTQYPTNNNDFAWKCSSINDYDSTLDVNGNHIRRMSDIRVKAIVTSSNMPLTRDEDWDVEEALVPMGVWGGAAAYLDFKEIMYLVHHQK